jgi:hypothetical protein
LSQAIKKQSEENFNLISGITLLKVNCRAKVAFYCKEIDKISKLYPQYAPFLRKFQQFFGSNNVIRSHLQEKDDTTVDKVLR